MKPEEAMKIETERQKLGHLKASENIWKSSEIPLKIYLMGKYLYIL